MAVFIGTSGWSYDHWQGVLYPHGIPLKDRLNYYVEQFRTVEVNSTYYRWPVDATFSGWRRRVPEGFVMTVKAPRGLSHHQKLLHPERWIERVSGGLQQLGEKLGILLVQLPPQFGCDLARLDYFLEKMPSWIRIAMEFRHSSWHCEEVFRLLEARSAAYCIMSGAHLPCILRATAPFVYVRFHGPDTEHMYGGSYSDNDLQWWADRIHEWQSQDRSVYGYFNNDGGGNAVRNAQRLQSFIA